MTSFNLNYFLRLNTIALELGLGTAAWRTLSPQLLFASLTAGLLVGSCHPAVLTA